MTRKAKRSGQRTARRSKPPVREMLDYIAVVRGLMAQQGKTVDDIAAYLKEPRSVIEKTLDERSNPTLRQMQDVMTALDVCLSFELTPKAAGPAIGHSVIVCDPRGIRGRQVKLFPSERDFADCVPERVSPTPSS